MSAVLSADGAAAPRDARGPLLALTLALAVYVAAAHLDAVVQALPTAPALAAVPALGAALVCVWVWRVWHERGGRTLRTGAILFAFLAMLWLVSRTVGVPFGARAPVGPVDAATTVDELLLVGAVLLLACPPSPALWRAGASLLPVSMFAALSVSFMLLSMGCSIGSARASTHAPGRSAPSVTLFCHLF